MSTDLDGVGSEGWEPVRSPTIRVSVAVIESDVPARETIQRELGDGATPFNSVEELAGRLNGDMPVVVVLGPSCATSSDLAITERLMNTHSALGAVLVVDQLTTETLQHALRAGVRDVLTLSGEPGQLAAAVERVAMGLDTTSRRTPGSGSGESTVGVDQPEMNGRVITVFSTKGGAGKSV